MITLLEDMVEKPPTGDTSVSDTNIKFTNKILKKFTLSLFAW